MKRKPKRENVPELTVTITMTVQVDPDEPNVGTYSADFDVNGPDLVVKIVRTAYRAGEMDDGIAAFIQSVARSLAPREPVVHSTLAGRA